MQRLLHIVYLTAYVRDGPYVWGSILWRAPKFIFGRAFSTAIPTAHLNTLLKQEQPLLPQCPPLPPHLRSRTGLVHQHKPACTPLELSSSSPRTRAARPRVPDQARGVTNFVSESCQSRIAVPEETPSYRCSHLCQANKSCDCRGLKRMSLGTQHPANSVYHNPSWTSGDHLRSPLRSRPHKRKLILELTAAPASVSVVGGEETCMIGHVRDKPCSQSAANPLIFHLPSLVRILLRAVTLH